MKSQSSVSFDLIFRLSEFNYMILQYLLPALYQWLESCHTIIPILMQLNALQNIAKKFRGLVVAFVDCSYETNRFSSLKWTDAGIFNMNKISEITDQLKKCSNMHRKEYCRKTLSVSV